MFPYIFYIFDIKTITPSKHATNVFRCRYESILVYTFLYNTLKESEFLPKMEKILVKCELW